MPQDLLLILSAIILGFAFVAWVVYRRLGEISEKQKPSGELVEWLKSTNQRLEEQSKNFTQTLQQNTSSLNERLDNAARVISGVQRSVGEMSEIGRGIKDLQDFLRNPKLRGNIGEQVLRQLLSQMLPKQSFHLQYTFKSGTTVDAAIETSAGIIPVDSKFPMENFRKMAKAQNEQDKKAAEKEFIRDVKRHIDDISKKYILTEEGTIDYALMYIPSEAVYYEIINQDESLIEYAYERRVLPVSPTTFYAYLRAILMSFEGQKIEARAKDILAAIKAVQKDYNRVDENLGVLGKHLNNAYNTMSQVVGAFTQLGQKISATQAIDGSSKKETASIDSATTH